MNTAEIKAIGTFLGFEIITYKGKDTFDGNKYAKTIGEIKNIFDGKYLMFTGRFCEDVAKDHSIQFDKDWNLLMLLIEKIKNTNSKSFLKKRALDSLINFNKIDTYSRCIDFMLWYNAHKN